jgi:hypothetical protein
VAQYTASLAAPTLCPLPTFPILRGLRVAKRPPELNRTLPACIATLFASLEYKVPNMPFPVPTISIIRMGETDYKTEVSRYSDEELLSKERSKRRRKTGDVVGTGLSAAAAMATPALWAVAGTSAKSYLDNSSKHKIICKEISRRGLEPMKEAMGDTLFPILASAGSMFVGRAFGGAAGQGVASQAGNLLQNVSSRAFSSTSKSSKKDKAVKKVSSTNFKIELTL